MIIRLTLATGSSRSGTKPDAGSHPSRTETSRISMIPSQKFGIDTPQSETALAATSHGVFRRTAASTPAGIASDNATRSARHASSTVIGSLIATVHATDCRVRIDSPRSPRRARPTPPEVLNRDRIAEAVFLADLLEPGGVRVCAGHDAGRVARDHAHAGEHDDRDQRQRDRRDERPADEELDHRTTASSFP